MNIDAIVFDCEHPASLARFWCEVLDGYAVAPYDDAEIARLKGLGIDDVEDDPGVLIESADGGPRIFFQRVDEPKAAKNRVHLDVWLRDGAQLDRLLVLGAVRQREWDDGTGWWLTDPQGNDFCVRLRQR